MKFIAIGYRLGQFLRISAFAVNKDVKIAVQFAIPAEEMCFQLGEAFNQFVQALANCSPASLGYLHAIDKVLKELGYIDCCAHLCCHYESEIVFIVPSPWQPQILRLPD